MGMDNIQVPPVGMRVPITPNAKAPSSVPRKKYKDGSEGGLTMNIQERIEALETEFNEKIKALKAEAQQGDEFPQDGDEYWYVDSDTEAMDIEWDGSHCDQGRLSIGNVFKTKEQAEFTAEKIKVEAELRKFSVPFKRGGNYTFNYYHGDEKIVNVYASLDYQEIGALYFESNEELNKAIQSVGEERIKKYIFEVEEL